MFKRNYYTKKEMQNFCDYLSKVFYKVDYKTFCILLNELMDMPKFKREITFGFDTKLFTIGKRIFK